MYISLKHTAGPWLFSVQIFNSLPIGPQSQTCPSLLIGYSYCTAKRAVSDLSTKQHQLHLRVSAYESDTAQLGVQ